MKKILVAEVVAYTSLIKIMLEREGYEVVTANTPQQAIDLADESIDLALIKLQLDSDEYIIAAELQRRLPNLNLVALSSIPESQLNGYKEAGYIDILVQPITPDDLVAKVQKYTSEQVMVPV